MGDNYKAAGSGSVESFVTAMQSSVQSQVAAFVTFVKNNPAILRALQQKDWTSFARS